MSEHSSQSGLVGVVLPVRAFRGAYTRLAAVLNDDQRAALAEALLAGVCRAAGALPTVIVSSDPGVHAWATAHSIAVIDDPGSLNAAAEAGRRYWAERGMGRAVIVHSDLPQITSLQPVLTSTDPETVILVPCHREDGTTVINVGTSAPWQFAYGPASFIAHQEIAARHALRVEVVRDPALSRDIDVAEDLASLPTAIAAALAAMTE
jgi:2-phospho-L-lactate guanylyltransferase